jgi:hypothetical protein
MWHCTNDEELVQSAVQLILANNGEFNYFDIGRALAGSGNWPKDNAAMLLAASVICHNIPYYKNKQRLIRNLTDCLRDVCTFYNANKAEGEIVAQSHNQAWYDTLTGFRLPEFSFGDNTHYAFKSGSGKSVPDLVGTDGYTYEVKRNYRDGSRASLHSADYLIDCKNTTIEIRKIAVDGSVDLEHYPAARINGFLNEKQGIVMHNISNGTAEKLMNGDFITRVEEALLEKGFMWNP